MLDAEGVLRHSMKSNTGEREREKYIYNTIGYKRKQRDWEENDYYDSDEDNFLDRTGDGKYVLYILFVIGVCLVDRKRKVRMRKAGKIEESVETFESLVRI